MVGSVVPDGSVSETVATLEGLHSRLGFRILSSGGAAELEEVRSRRDEPPADENRSSIGERPPLGGDSTRQLIGNAFAQERIRSSNATSHDGGHGSDGNEKAIERIYSEDDSDVVRVCGFTYALGEKLGSGSYGTVYRVEMLIPRYTRVELQDGRPSVDAEKNILLRLPSWFDEATNRIDESQWVVSGISYALKIVSLTEDSAKSSERRALHAYEISLLEQFQGCDNIVQIIDSEVRDRQILILLELAHGTLGQWLFPAPVQQAVGGEGGEDATVSGDEAPPPGGNGHAPVAQPTPWKKNAMRSLDPWVLLEIWMQLVHAVASVHTVGVIHFDIKPSNILLFEGKSDADPPTLKLADFGLGRQLQGSQSHISASCGWGTLKYMAPEVVYQPTENFEFRNVGSQIEERFCAALRRT